MSILAKEHIISLNQIYLRDATQIDGRKGWLIRRIIWLRNFLFCIYCRLGIAIQSKLRSSKITIFNSVLFTVPVRMDGLGQVVIESNVLFGFRRGPRLGNGEILIQSRKKTAKILIGSNTKIGNNCSIISQTSIQIGSNCLIADTVKIYDTDFHPVKPNLRHCGEGSSQEVKLEDNVWIGSNCLVLKGVTIGENSVIAAGSVVTKSIPKNYLAAGVPARLIKEL